MKRVLLVGATSGIGRELAIRYIEMGYCIGIAGRRVEELKKLQELAPDRIFYEQIDVTKENAADSLMHLIEKMQGMDLFILCSGIGYQNSSLDIDIEMKTAETNVGGFIRMVTAAFNYFKKDGGHIAVISSVAGTKGLGIAPAYSATKRFQNTYIESLEQLANIKGYNIKFTDIRPGFVDTPLLGKTNYPMLMKVEYVADKIISAIKSNKRVAIIDWRFALIVFFWSMIPRSLWCRLKMVTQKS